MNIPNNIIETYVSIMEQADNGGMTLAETLGTYDEFAQINQSGDYYTFPNGVNGKFMEGIMYLYKEIGLRIKFIGNLIDSEPSNIQVSMFSAKPTWIFELFKHALKVQYQD